MLEANLVAVYGSESDASSCCAIFTGLLSLSALYSLVGAPGSCRLGDL